MIRRRLPCIEHDEELGGVVLAVLAPEVLQHLFVIERFHNNPNHVELGANCGLFAMVPEGNRPCRCDLCRAWPTA